MIAMTKNAPVDPTDKSDIRLGVSPDIIRQLGEVAKANGLKKTEQYRRSLINGLRDEQERLRTIGLLDADLNYVPPVTPSE